MELLAFASRYVAPKTVGISLAVFFAFCLLPYEQAYPARGTSRVAAYMDLRR